MTEVTSPGCYARLDGSLLTVGTESIERRWRIGPAGGLRSESVAHRTSGREWIAAASGDSGPATGAAAPEATLAEVAGSETGVGERGLEVVVTGPGWQYQLRVYPAVAAVVLRRGTGISAPSVAAAQADGVSGTGIESDEARKPADSASAADPGSALDTLALAPQHLRLTKVLLMDRTDVHNELVSEREWLLHPSESRLTLSGGILYVEDPLTGDGLALLKLAPLPHARPNPLAADFEVRSRERTIGVLEPEDYAVAAVAYSGGKWGRVAALQQFQRCLRRVEPGRDGVFLSNTWGDRNRDQRISETFLRGEIEAGARLGVEVVQIDDGWQRGTTANSAEAKARGGVWEGFYAADPDFWTPHPARLPNGLEPLVASAKERGLRLGLWFAPDSTDDFAHWERDAATLLGLHRRHGIDHYKIDGVKMRTKAGERNLRRLFDRALAESGGRMVFDLDVTAEVRPGYFGMPDVGPLFVENRYTDFHRYWPHQTLRNLWKLAHHLDPVRLRMEFLNHARNEDQYEGDPLAPAAFLPDYLFATVMMASPLGWFEVQNLPDSYFARAAPLIETWKRHRVALHGGAIYPIGSAPDGVAWTGFASVASDGSSAYVLAFRGWNDPDDDQWLIEVPAFTWSDWGTRIEVLGGRGTLGQFEEGAVVAEIPTRNDFLFARLERGGKRQTGTDRR